MDWIDNDDAHVAKARENQKNRVRAIIVAQHKLDGIIEEILELRASLGGEPRLLEMLDDMAPSVTAFKTYLDSYVEVR